MFVHVSVIGTCVWGLLVNVGSVFIQTDFCITQRETMLAHICQLVHRGRTMVPVKEKSSFFLQAAALMVFKS